MAADVPEPLANRKRKLEDPEEDDSSNSDNSESANSSKQTRTSDYSTYTVDEGGEGSRKLSSPLANKDEGKYSASKWNNADLKYVHIFYEESPVTLEEFMKEVKDTFKNVKGFCPDPCKIIDTLKKHLENLAFSYDMAGLRNDRKYSKPKMELQIMEKEMKKYLQEWSKNSEKMLDKNQSYEALDSSLKKSAQKLIIAMDLAVQTFAGETMQLVRKVLLGNPSSSSNEKERGKGKRRGGRARARYRGLHGGRESTGYSHIATTENFFQNYCDIFGRMFFLATGEILQGSFYFGKQIVRNTPDLVYHYLTDNEDEDELFFIIEAKKAAAHEGATGMEELVGQNIMGQVGSELFGQSPRSLFFPNSFGIICMETKLIFVYLKISLEHSKCIRKGDRGSPDDPGKIMYTKPFDILKAEDRLQMADFMFWLGFVQDVRKYDFL